TFLPLAIVRSKSWIRTGRFARNGEGWFSVSLPPPNYRLRTSHTVSDKAVKIPFPQAFLSHSVAGLALAAAFGILFGMLMARSTAVHWLLDPLVALGFPSPKIAFLPVFILWFGIESVSKILLVGFACMLPVIIGTFSAARAVNLCCSGLPSRSEPAS